MQFSKKQKDKLDTSSKEKHSETKLKSKFLQNIILFINR